MEEGPQNTNYHTRKLNIYREKSFNNFYTTDLINISHIMVVINFMC